MRINFKIGALCSYSAAFCPEIMVTGSFYVVYFQSGWIVCSSLCRSLNMKFVSACYRFATRERNALLLYNGRFNEKHDFIALEIIEEQIQLTFSAGKVFLAHLV